MLQADHSESTRLHERLAAYLTDQVDDGATLTCSSQALCRASVGADFALIEGQGSYVGPMYNLNEGGAQLRILVVPKQVGGSLEQGGSRGHEHVTMAQRAQQVESAKYGARPHPRTNHMIGTELALKALLGRADSDPPTVVVNGEDVHVFDCFAMCNATLCSRVGRDASGQGSRLMFEQCLAHLKRAIAILRPTVVLAQGWNKSGWSPSRSAAAAFGLPLPAKNELTLVETPYGRVALVTAEHPARSWFAPTMPKWRALRPVLERARRAVINP